MDFMNLPLVMIEHIFSFLTFDEIAKARLVSKSFDELSRRLLNRGFGFIERRHSLALKAVKAQLPRRESERRYHQLSRHCDILTSIETRISMLNMTYSKFIDHDMCCFIPGRVIDEIRRVLNLVETETNPPRAHEVLQELRDISSMAIEHFDDKISPVFRKKLQEGATQPPRTSHSVLAPFVVKQEMSILRRRCYLNSRMALCMASQHRKLYQKVRDHKQLIWRQKQVLKLLVKRQSEQDATIADLKKRIEDCDIKYSEFTHANVGGKAMAGTSEMSSSSQPLRHFSSQINLDLSVLPIGNSKRGISIMSNMKPRKAQIRLPSLSETDQDGEPPAKLLKSDSKGKKTRPANDTKNRASTSGLQTVKSITEEIKQLGSGLKRALDGELSKETKKQKMD